MKKLLKEILEEQKQQTKILQSIENKLEDSSIDLNMTSRDTRHEVRKKNQAYFDNLKRRIGEGTTINKSISSGGFPSFYKVNYALDDFELLENTHSFEEVFPEITQQMKECALKTDSSERLKRANAAYFDNLKRGGY